MIDSWSGKGKHIESLESGHLEFKDVHFRYPTRPHVPVLRGLHFELKPGQYVALVGSSGCGKSTAVQLIERFYDPLVGQVLVDGMDVQGYNLSEYRKNISLVSQEPTLYQGTIRFNILLGATRDDVTEEEIDQACKDANVPSLSTFSWEFELIINRFTISFSLFHRAMRRWSAHEDPLSQVVKNNASPSPAH